MAVQDSDERFQEQILPHVSRTFALTIPQLPVPLRASVVNAYLLCRIADTIEDEPAVSAAETRAFLQRFVAVVSGSEPAAPLARQVAARLTERTLPAERELVANMQRVTVPMRHGEGRAAVLRCIELMCDGMHQFQRTASIRGLAHSSDLDSYCYYVAGVVGEMLTELFCHHAPDIAAHRATLQELAPSFAQGLQLTNILKDFWEDRSRGACWLPQEVFMRHGLDLAQLSEDGTDARFHAGMTELVGVAHGHLRNALAYTLAIPSRHTGIRRFCLWAIGLAVLTLRKIAAQPQFTAGAQVKVSRRAVCLTQLCSSAAVRSDRLLIMLFERAARGLPLTEPPVVRRAAARAAALAATVHENQHWERQAQSAAPI